MNQPMPATSLAYEACPEPAGLPIAVDVDGTFLHVDTLHEGVALLLLRQPWMIFAVIAALFRGKAAFKAFIAQRAPLTCDKLPVNRPLHDLLRQEHAKGRRIALFSAADQSTVDRLCEAYPLFESGHGSDGRRNLSGKAKLAVIREKLGDEFVYAGNAPADFHVWRGSAAAIVVSPSSRFTRKVERALPVHHAFSAPRRGLKTWMRGLRVHQWAKNALVFVPALMSIPKLTPALMGEFFAGFAALCAVASATYLVNDLFDLDSDRQHHSKCNRPLASGAIPLLQGVLAAIVLLAIGLAFAWLLPPLSGALVVAYLVGSLAYSFAVKRIALLDTITLGALFTVRIAVGAAILRSNPPFWLFAFSMFFFTSLAFVKRHAELIGRPQDSGIVPGRGYAPVDLPLVVAAGTGCALSSIVVFLIYIGGGEFDRSLFTDPGWLGVIPVALGYWVLRIWSLALRNQMHEDPVLFAIRDKTSYLVATFVVMGLLLAW